MEILRVVLDVLGYLAVFMGVVVFILVLVGCWMHYTMSVTKDDTYTDVKVSTPKVNVDPLSKKERKEVEKKQTITRRKAVKRKINAQNSEVA